MRKQYAIQSSIGIMLHGIIQVNHLAVYQVTIQVLNQVINLLPCEERYVPTTGTSTTG